MSVTREEGRQKNGCPSRGLGIAAVAIGAGVGAALYYFFNKRAEHANGEGSSDWNNERSEPFRERSWTVEDCSICFDQMLRHQDLTRLPCSHNFHTECILPWLQEKQTCPYCRKSAE